MKPWNLNDTSEIPAAGGEQRLYRHCDDYSLMIAGQGELMSSRMHGSEDALAELGCAHLTGKPGKRVLVGASASALAWRNPLNR